MIYKLVFQSIACFSLNWIFSCPVDAHWKTSFFESLNSKYGSFPESLRKEMKEESKKMFYFAYDSYMEYAFPMDELNPINCSGRGPDYENPSNININDVLGMLYLTVGTLDYTYRLWQKQASQNI